MKNILFLLLCIFSYTKSSTNLITIATTAYNQPQFISLQYTLLKKFSKEPFRFIVFNDAPNKTLKDVINFECNNLNIECYTVPENLHKKEFVPRFIGEPLTLTVRSAQTANYAFHQSLVKNDNNILVFIDADIFLIKPFSFVEYLENFSLATRLLIQENYTYCWPGLMIINTKKASDLSQLNLLSGRIKNTPLERGGYSSHYLKKHPSSCKKINAWQSSHFNWCTDITCNKKDCIHNQEALKTAGLECPQLQLLTLQTSNLEFLCNHHFLHYNDCSNKGAKSKDYHSKKQAACFAYLNFLRKLNYPEKKEA